MSKIFIANKYGVAPNHLLNDKDISLKAKGLYVFIQAKPDGWSFSAKRISLQTKEGIEGVTSGLKELEEMGYLQRKRTQDNKGHWQVDYYLYEKPSQENPTSGNPIQGNRHNISKKEYSNKDIVIKNKTSDKVADVIKLFERVDVKNKKYYGNTTQREKAKFLLEEHGFENLEKIIDYYLMMKGDKFLPSISSPFELVEKWSKLEDFFLRKKAEQNQYAEKVIF